MTHRTHFNLACLALATALPAMAVPPSSAREPAAWEWKGISRVVAVGDLHGNPDKAIRLLTGAGLVDGNQHWVGGADHLVVAGDFIDRGSGDRPLMDLLRRLQRESAAAGGRVHVLLGNHEVMNLLRDTRDVNLEAYESFADVESKTARKNGWRAFFSASVGRSPADSLFGRQFPPGFFARQEAFDPDGEYGNWLVELPVVVKINDVVYLHGGLSEEFAALGLDEINRSVAAKLRSHLDAREVLEGEGLVTPVMRFVEIGETAHRMIERPGRRSPETLAAARALLASADSPILRDRGPLWYRGNSFEDERIERHTIERSLELVDARVMVVAHSPTRDGKITSRFHGQLFRIDHGIGESERPLALVVEKGEVLVLDPSNGEKIPPASELPPGTYHRAESAAVPDAKLEEFLAEAEIVDSRELGRGGTRPRLVVLRRHGQTRRAVFKTVQTESGANAAADRYQHEVAAYRLDRRLGLGMVPVTVIRRIEDQTGSLQWWIERAVDREAAGAYELELYETASARAQLARGELFDALIGNPDRQPTDVLLSLNGEGIRFIDHSEAFSASPELHWEGAELAAVDRRLVAASRSLDHASLRRDLGELLSEPQIEALLARRDQILARLEAAAGTGSAAQTVKLSQYDSAITSRHGRSACGLFSLASALGGKRSQEALNAEIDRLRAIADRDDSYDERAGIQPSFLLSVAEKAYPDWSVEACRDLTLGDLGAALDDGHRVIVDIQVGVAFSEGERPSSEHPNLAHFARVLGLDSQNRRVILENSLRGGPSWELSTDEFLAVWKHPETAVSIQFGQRHPNPKLRPEDVTHWALIGGRRTVTFCD